MTTDTLTITPGGEYRTRFVKGKARREFYPLVICPNCGNERYVRQDAPKDVLCFRCSQREKAHLGWQAMCAKYGEKWAIPYWQAWRLEHPSTLEQAIMLTLGDMGIPYEREVLLKTKASGKRQRCYLIDFVIPVGGILYAIEVNGEYVHQFHAKRDRRKLSLLKRRAFPVLVIQERDIRAGRAEAMIGAFIPIRSLEIL